MRREERLGMPGGFVEGTTRRVVVIVEPLGRRPRVLRVEGTYPRASRKAPPATSQMSLTARQNTPALDAAIYYPNGTLYQLQPSFHKHSTEPEPTARARRAGEEFY